VTATTLGVETTINWGWRCQQHSYFLSNAVSGGSSGNFKKNNQPDVMVCGSNKIASGSCRPLQ